MSTRKLRHKSEAFGPNILALPANGQSVQNNKYLFDMMKGYSLQNQGCRAKICICQFYSFSCNIVYINMHKMRPLTPPKTNWLQSRPAPNLFLFFNSISTYSAALTRPVMHESRLTYKELSVILLRDIFLLSIIFSASSFNG